MSPSASQVKSRRIALLTALGSLLAEPALAAPTASPPAVAAPGDGQPGLAVGSDASGVLRAKLCAAAPCDVAGGLTLGVPKELAAQVARARLAVVGIGLGRRAIVVTVPGARDGQRFEVVVAAPLAGNAPRIVFAGYTGLVEGSDGVRQGKVIQISEPDEDGARHIVIGDTREDLDLCGRTAALSPTLLSATDLQLHGARVQRLSTLEREQAAKLSAERVADDAPKATGGILRALGASSALGNPGGLSDGRPETSWTEGRTGSGRGEFAVLAAPAELPLIGFELTVRPTGTLAPRAVAPRVLWLVTRKQVFEVSLPNDAEKAPGARYRVNLPQPVQTDCVAAVLDTAFSERPEAEVGIAELAAVTELSNREPAALVAALVGGQERAQAAGALLRALGRVGFEEVVKGFEKLDEAGRRLALDVLDSAPCETAGPVYLNALLSSFEAQRAHAQGRLRRCGRATAGLLEERFPLAQGTAALILADELSLIAPELAVNAITRRVASSPARERRALRVILARAASSDAARGNVQKLLQDPALPALAALELLRSLGPRTQSFLPDSLLTLRRLQTDASFRVRYLLLGPAATLAGSEPDARSLLQRALQDPADPRLRARAVELMPRDPAATPGVLAALRDADVRVRENAAFAVRDARLVAAAKDLALLLERDEWPLVRRAAADAFAALPAEPSGDAALLAALGDETASVRAATASALGARRVVSATKPLRKRLEDTEERFDVRRAAASSLAQLCDQDSVGALTDLTKRLSDPMATVEQRALGEAALQALVVLAPSDLASRLAPLSKTRASNAVAQALRRPSGPVCKR